MDEYYHLGKVTEFKAGRDISSCVSQGGNFECLANYPYINYGPGLNVLTFIDNHDTQRGGGVLTFESDYQYKLAQAFHLAHDYGFKRIMTSYYFSDYDQGPPYANGDSLRNAGCGVGWVCEHRWSSIANMVQFTNVCAGNPVENIQTKSGSIGFSRGNVGFFAMGDLNGVNFFTGMPEGDYCDIIHDCAQTITVGSNGFATISAFQSNDPVVAICQDCIGIGVVG